MIFIIINQSFEYSCDEKNILSTFYTNAKTFVARHQAGTEAVIGGSYVLGDGLVLAIPPYANGFLDGLVHLHPDWVLLASSYADRPLPAIASALFLANGLLTGRGSFAAGQGVAMVGSLALIKDFIDIGNTTDACLTVACALGGAVGMLHKPLRKKFGSSKYWILRETLGTPKRLTGYLYNTMTVPLCFTNPITALTPISGSALSWTLGNGLMGLLPADPESPQPPRPPLQPQPSCIGWNW